MPTEYEIEQQKLKRQQQIADAMLASGLEPIQTQRTAGPYVAPVHWAEVLGKWAQVYAGKRASEKADDKALALARTHEQSVSDQLTSLLQPQGQPQAAPAAPQTASTPMPVPQEPATPQYEARGMMANILGDIGMKPNTAGPGVREQYTGPVAPLPGYLQRGAPASPQDGQPTAAGQPSQPDPLEARITALQGERNKWLLMASHPEPRLAATAAAQLKSIDDEIKSYRDAALKERGTQVVGGGYIIRNGKLERVNPNIPQPETRETAEAYITTNYDGFGNPTVTVRPKPKGGNTTYVQGSPQERSAAWGYARSMAEAARANLQSSRSQVSNLVEAENALRSYEGDGGRGGPLTGVAQGFWAFLNQAGFPLSQESYRKLISSRTLDATEKRSLVDWVGGMEGGMRGITKEEVDQLRQALQNSRNPNELNRTLIRIAKKKAELDAKASERVLNAWHQAQQTDDPSIMADPSFVPDYGSGSIQTNLEF